MKSICVLLLAATGAVPLAAQQTFTGRISDTLCSASHQSNNAAGELTDRQCLFACIRRLAKYVLVDPDGNVLSIGNQDAMGLPLYAGRPVRITGELQGDRLVVGKIEAIPAHLHVGHVMTNWRDTPGSRGFLPVAADEARTALVHARLAAGSATLDDIRLHAGHVLNALDPAVEPKGPGAGYGAKKAAAGALQHLELAVKAEGATDRIAKHAAAVAPLLSTVLPRIDEAVAAAQAVRTATDAGEASRAAADLVALTLRISDEILQRAQAEMTLMLKAEGLFGMPR